MERQVSDDDLRTELLKIVERDRESVFNKFRSSGDAAMAEATARKDVGEDAIARLRQTFSDAESKANDFYDRMLDYVRRSR